MLTTPSGLGAFTVRDLRFDMSRGKAARLNRFYRLETLVAEAGDLIAGKTRLVQWRRCHGSRIQVLGPGAKQGPLVLRERSHYLPPPVG